jgi:hypothetical protein
VSVSNDQVLFLVLDCRLAYLSPIYALNFSIAIICVSPGEGTHLLGKVETSRGKILSSVEENQSKDNMH